MVDCKETSLMSETFKDKNDESMLDDELMENLAYSDSDGTINMIEDDLIDELDQIQNATASVNEIADEISSDKAIEGAQTETILKNNLTANSDEVKHENFVEKVICENEKSEANLQPTEIDANLVNISESFHGDEKKIDDTNDGTNACKDEITEKEMLPVIESEQNEQNNIKIEKEIDKVEETEMGSFGSTKKDNNEVVDISSDEEDVLLATEKLYSDVNSETSKTGNKKISENNLDTSPILIDDDDEEEDETSTAIPADKEQSRDIKTVDDIKIPETIETICTEEKIDSDNNEKDQIISTDKQTAIVSNPITVPSKMDTQNENSSSETDKISNENAIVETDNNLLEEMSKKDSNDGYSSPKNALLEDNTYASDDIEIDLESTMQINGIPNIDDMLNTDRGLQTENKIEKKIIGNTEQAEKTESVVNGTIEKGLNILIASVNSVVNLNVEEKTEVPSNFIAIEDDEDTERKKNGIDTVNESSVTNMEIENETIMTPVTKPVEVVQDNVSISEKTNEKMVDDDDDVMLIDLDQEESNVPSLKHSRLGEKDSENEPKAKKIKISEFDLIKSDSSLLPEKVENELQIKISGEQSSSSTSNAESNITTKNDLAESNEKKKNEPNEILSVNTIETKDTSQSTSRSVSKGNEPIPTEKRSLRLDFLNKFKKSFDTMTRTDLEQLVLQKISEAIMHRSECSELRKKTSEQEELIKKFRMKFQEMEKQFRDLETVHRNLMKDMGTNAKIIVSPLRITRAVGLQVSIGRLAAPNAPIAPALTKLTPVMRAKEPPKPKEPAKTVVNANRITPLQHQMQQILGQQNSIRQPRAQQQQQQFINRNITRVPMIRGPQIMPRVIAPVINPVYRNRTIIRAPNPPLARPPNYVTVSKAKAATVKITPTNPPVQALQLSESTIKPLMAGRPNPTNGVVDLTEEEDSTAKRTALRVAQNSTSPKPQTSQGQPRGHMKYTPIAPKIPPQVDQAAAQLVRSIQQKTQATQASVALQKRAMRPVHPAPLPPTQTQPMAHAGWKKGPPRPTIRINNVNNGIVISWTMDDLTTQHANIASYQIYGYQETNDAPSTDSWRHIGDVKAMLLPMAVTLTQFQEGQRYHFAVRARDIHNRLSSFSLPKTWD